MNDAVYPVTIDPVIHSTNAVHNIQDTTLGEGQSAKPYTGVFFSRAIFAFVGHLRHESSGCVVR